MELNFTTLQDEVKGSPPTTWTFLIRLSQLHCGFHSKEGDKAAKVSNSELKRWLMNSAVIINGEQVKWDELIDFPVFSIVLFPKSDKHRTTIL